MTKAVILAAGRGTRMKELTAQAPKPMLVVAGKPLLEHLLDRLRAAGFTEALIVTGYRADLIERHFSGWDGGTRLRVRFIRQETIDGTGSATLLGRGFAGPDAFLLTFGDIVTSAQDYAGIARRLESDQDAAAAAGVKHVDDPWQGAAVYEQDGVVTGIVEKPPRGTSTTHWNSAGLYAFRPVIFDHLARIEKSARGEYELTSALESLLKSGERLLLYEVAGGWRDVGRPEDLEIARDLLSAPPRE